MGLLFSSSRRSTTNNYSSTEVTVDNTMSPAAIGHAEKIRDKVEEHIVLQTTVQDNIINGIVYAFMPHNMTDSVHFHIRFKLNGRELHIKEVMSREDYANGPGAHQSNSIESKRNCIELITPYIAKALSSELTKMLFPTDESFNINR